MKTSAKKIWIAVLVVLLAAIVAMTAVLCVIGAKDSVVEDLSVIKAEKVYLASGNATYRNSEEWGNYVEYDKLSPVVRERIRLLYAPDMDMEEYKAYSDAKLTLYKSIIKERMPYVTELDKYEAGNVLVLEEALDCRIAGEIKFFVSPVKISDADGKDGIEIKYFGESKSLNKDDVIVPYEVYARLAVAQALNNTDLTDVLEKLYGDVSPYDDIRNTEGVAVKDAVGRCKYDTALYDCLKYYGILSEGEFSTHLLRYSADAVKINIVGYYTDNAYKAYKKELINKSVAERGTYFESRGDLFGKWIVCG